MQKRKLAIGGTCDLVWATYDCGGKDVSLDYIEHSADHYHSDSQTSLTIDEPMAREIVAFLQAAFNLK